MSQNNVLPPLPRRIWWPWDESAARVGFYHPFQVEQAAQATLYVSASGPYAAWLDDRWLPVPDAPLPSWRAMHRFRVELTPGDHALNILATAGDHGQPFLLACLDWEEDGHLLRVGTDELWYAVLEPPLEWMPLIPRGAVVPCDIVPPGGRGAVFDERSDAWREAFPPEVEVHVEGASSDAANGGAANDGAPKGARGTTYDSLPQDGRASAFENSAWSSDGVWAEPWGMPCNAPDDFCRLSTGWQTMTGQRLTQVAGLYHGLTAAGAMAQVHEDGTIVLRPVPPYPESPPRLENTRPRDMWHLIRETHSLATNSWLDLFEGRAPHVLLDVGHETFARVRVRLRGGGPAILALTTGESVPETQRYDRRITDVFELRDGEAFTTSPTGLRYVKVMALSAGKGDVTVDPVEVQHIRYPAEQIGQFTCSDPLLSQVWAISAHTVHLCMQNEIWDAIKRDQLPWMGDLAMEALAVYHVFGDARLVRRSLAVLGEVGPAPARSLDEQLYPGLQAVWKGEDGEMNGVPSYTLWWVVGLADYVRYTGDRSLVREYASELVATLQHIAGHVRGDGLWRSRTDWNFVDWAPIPPQECEVFCHLLACLAMGLGTNLLALLGRLDAAEYCSALWMQMVDAARRIWFGSDLAGLGSDRSDAACRICPQPVTTAEPTSAPGCSFHDASHHVQAMAIRSGCLSAFESTSLFACSLAADLPMPMTHWHRYADLDAAARVGQVEWGLNYLRRHWAYAAEAGMTTLWEAFDPAWMGDDPHGVSMVADQCATYGGYRTSHCHGWSAGPAVWLHTAVLGISPAEPGFTAIDWDPSLGDLDWAEGTVPTPHGPIHVELRRQGPAPPRAALSAPQGVEVRIGEHIRQAWEIEVRCPN